MERKRHRDAATTISRNHITADIRDGYLNTLQEKQQIVEEIQRTRELIQRGQTIQEQLTTERSGIEATLSADGNEQKGRRAWDTTAGVSHSKRPPPKEYPPAQTFPKRNTSPLTPPPPSTPPRATVSTSSAGSGHPPKQEIFSVDSDEAINKMGALLSGSAGRLAKHLSESRAEDKWLAETGAAERATDPKAVKISDFVVEANIEYDEGSSSSCMAVEEPGEKATTARRPANKDMQERFVEKAGVEKTTPKTAPGMPKGQKQKAKRKQTAPVATGSSFRNEYESSLQSSINQMRDSIQRRICLLGGFIILMLFIIIYNAT